MHIQSPKPIALQAYANTSQLLPSSKVAAAANDQAIPVPQSLEVLSAETTGGLEEISVSPPTVLSGNDNLPRATTLKSESGSGNIPAQMATSLYALSHSFDVQKQMLDVLI